MPSDDSINLLKAMHYSEVCACGDKKPSHGVFCENCWFDLPIDLKLKWNCMVARAHEGVKKTGQAPAEAVEIYFRCLSALGLEVPCLDGERLTIVQKAEG